MTAILDGGAGILLAAIFLSAAVATVGLALVLDGSGGLAKRTRRRVADLRSRLADDVCAAPAASVKRAQPKSTIRGLDTILGPLIPKPAALRARLVRTGRAISLGEYALAGLVLCLVGAVMSGLVFRFPPILALMFGMACGVGLPHLVVGRMIARRLKKFTAVFPQAIDLIVRGLRSGLPVADSIGVVGDEMPDPVGIEFRRIDESIKFGRNVDEAMWDAATRIDTPEFRFFVISLAIQRETGGNLAETLENLAGILRRRKQVKMKIKAMSSEAKASAMIIGSLPFLMLGILQVMSPEYVLVLFTDPRGMMVGGMGLSLLVVGVLIMSKMVRFEI